MRNIKPSGWYAIAAVFAFASSISFFQIDSAWADEHHANWLWYTGGFLFAIITFIIIYNVIIMTNKRKDE